MNYKKINNISGWIVFLIASVVYLLSVEPTASFWDCGEFIACAYKLEIGHPPGAPIFMIIGRIFTLFAGSPEKIALSMNVMSALASSFTILFLFWTITRLVKKIMPIKEKITSTQIITIIGAGLVGALAYTFSDTFWFSAVEAEVYAMASLFTAAVFWAIFKWDELADEPHSDRWLILIALLMGVSIGVHLLNLLALPAMALVYYFRKYKPTTKGTIIALIISFLLLALVLYGVIQGVLKIASWFELFFVNTLGMPFNSGLIVYLIILTGLLIFGLYYTVKKGKVLWNTILLCLTVILIGYSSVIIIPIRSAANPPLDENNPDNIFSLVKYVNREIYGQRPLLQGAYYNAPVQEYAQGKKVYVQKDGKYIVADRETKKIYDERFETIFPRIYNSTDPKYAQAYKKWADIKGTPVTVTNNQGEPETIQKPTFSENMKYFFRYQLGHMYFRYFMWNFAGRQNDVQGHGDLLNGNWLTGINFWDSARLGPQDKLPPSLERNKGYNTYYALPLLLGLIGAVFMYSRRKNLFWVLTLLFFMTGIAIIVYLNEVPQTPRERDYVYAGSFYAFSIFIGLGVVALIEALKKYIKGNPAAVGVSLICLLLVPGIMAKENWDDHDRSGRYVARDMAYNYLTACDENSMLFSGGDNDTFPLWYIQEVEGFRTDVRVVCQPFVPHDWYIDQMKRKYYESDPLPISLTRDQYMPGRKDVVLVYPRFNTYYNLKEIMEFIASDEEYTQQSTANGMLDFIPTNKFKIPVDSAKVLRNKVIPEKWADIMVPEVQIDYQGNYIFKDALILLDLLAHSDWDRKMYFTSPNQDAVSDVQNYLQLCGFSYKFVPVKTEENAANYGVIDTEEMYDNLMNKFRFGGVREGDVYLEESSRRMLQNIRNNFNRLALELITEGDKEKAVEVLDRLMEVLPDKTLAYDYLSISTADYYFMADAHEKGKKILEELYSMFKNEAEYYMSFKGAKLQAVSLEIQQYLRFYFPSIVQVARSGGESEFADRVEEESNNLLMSFVEKAQIRR